jgi:hypothetical protein
MVYPYLTLAANRLPPRFPTPPARQTIIENMPNDLIANGRNYYTEITFVDYRTGVLGTNNFVNRIFDSAADAGAGRSSLVAGALLGGAVGGLTGSLPGALVGGGLGAASGYAATTGGTVNLAAIRLPIPNTINDVTVLNWNVRSATSDLGSLIGGAIGPNLSTAGSIAIGAVGAATGKALNPLLYAAFNRAEFRQFTFDWILAPRTRKESETLKNIVRTFKAASLPSGAGLILDYPLLAIITMHPDNLDGLATFWPMAITSVNINYTSNPGGPSFFENSGAPTVATLTVNLMEIKMRRREEVQNGIG